MQENKPYQKQLTPKQALAKAESYCAYQERAHQEVRDKLYSWGLHSADVEGIIAHLISENFLNEERFAIAYTLGKFRIKHWGKIKIKSQLKLKRVPEKIIKHALNQINNEEYFEKIEKITESKLKTIKNEKEIIKKYKTTQFLMSKGYETDIINEFMSEKMKNN